MTATLLTLMILTPAADPKPLFNGKDLTGWETYLRTPKGKAADQYGLNKDPDGVFSVVSVDDKPALRISGEQFGAITTKDEYENYRLRLEVKWGTKKWPPRENVVRDSGILYHCIGKHGVQDGAWMKSFECQIQEDDFGDFHSVAHVIVDVTADDKTPQGHWIFKPGGTLRTGVKTRIVRTPKADNREGWNVVEVYCLGATAVHVTNGKTNMVLTNLRHNVKVDGQNKWEEKPLTKGKIQLQTEGAEVFYRNIEITPITELPKP
jgi:hypothetical protein